VRWIGISQFKAQEQPTVTLKPACQEWFRQFAGVVREQLRFYAMHARRLLQGFKNVLDEAEFESSSILAVWSDEEVADDAFAALIDEEAVADEAASFDCGISGQNLRIHISQDHVGRAAIVPRKLLSPLLDFLVEEGSQVRGRKVPEV